MLGTQEPPEILGLMELAVALVMVKCPAGLTWLGSEPEILSIGNKGLQYISFKIRIPDPRVILNRADKNLH